MESYRFKSLITSTLRKPRGLKTKHRKTSPVLLCAKSRTLAYPHIGVCRTLPPRLLRYLDSLDATTGQNHLRQSHKRIMAALHG